jgi:alanine racemase
MDLTQKNPPFAPLRLAIDLKAIAANYRTVRGLVGPADAAAVVKADAYGLGVRAVAPTLIGAGCESFVVARVAEGIALRLLAPTVRIFVLDGAPAGSIAALAAYRLTPVLNSLDEISAWSEAGRAAHTALEAAVHIDTGMNRLGLSGDDVSVLSAEHAARLAGVKVVLWVSHLACSDEPDSPMNGVQLARFRAALAKLPPAPASLSASGGIMLGRDYHFDLVRPGICLYGGNPMPPRENPFATAVRCLATILQVRHANPGETAGYGATFKVARPSLLAVVGMGYADGLMRRAAAGGGAAVNGVRVPLAGRVSMDLATLDVTGLKPPPQAGMTAEFFGDIVSLDEFAASAGTISYEILTQLSRRAARSYEEAA